MTVSITRRRPKMIWVLAGSALWYGAVGFDAYAVEKATQESSTIGCDVPEENTNTAKEDGWSVVEAWVWQEICQGREANLRVRSVMEEGADRNPWDNARRLAERTVSARFLRMILVDEPFRSAIPSQGVRISGVHIEDKVILRDVVIDRPVLFEQCAFKSGLDMRRLRTSRDVSFSSQCVISELLDLTSASLGGDLDLSRGKFKKVDLSEAEIGGQVNLDGSTFYDGMNMYATAVDGKLSMWDVSSGSGFLHGLRVRGTVDMRGSTFSDTLTVDSSKIEGDLIVGQSAPGMMTFQNASMESAQIGGDLDLRNSKFEGPLVADSISVGGDLLMGGAEAGIASFVSHRIDGNLEVHGATLKTLNLLEGRIGGTLRLASFEDRVKWKGIGNLILRNLTAGALQDSQDGWGNDEGKLDLELDGFRYGYFVGSGEMESLGWIPDEDEHEDPYRRSSEWFIQWLKQDPTYTRQPYLHLANVLRSAGYGDKADDILFEDREMQRERAESVGTWLFLSGLKVTIGYGYGWRYFCVLGWAGFFAAIGGAVLRLRRVTHNGEKLGVLYSLDMLLPGIRLRETHYDVDLGGNWIGTYFAVHKLVGYVLTFFVIAGLAGLAG